MIRMLSCCVLASSFIASAEGGTQEGRVILKEDFAGELSTWGIPRQPEALLIERGVTIVPVFEVGDATVEYRAKVRGSGLVELMFRFDLDADDYYLFRIDTRTNGGDPPGFLKRHHGEPPWIPVGQRTGSIPAPDTWLNVRVELAGKVFRGYVNGQLVATYEDADFKVGGFAFRQQVSNAWIDDLTITVPAGTTFKQMQPTPPRKPKPPAPFTEGTWSAHWIWSPGGEQDGVRIFRKAFDVPGAVREATVAVTCDNEYELYLNGELIGRDRDWYSLETYDVKSKIRPGKNILAVFCKNAEPGGAGLLLELGAHTEEGRFVHVFSDKSWKVSKVAPPHWTARDFDDSAWATADSVGKHPCGPWANQTALRLPYLGPKQPIDLVGVTVPPTIEVGQPCRIQVTWKPTGRLADAYPIVLTASQDDQPPIDIATFQPLASTATWKVGQEHTETITVELWPDVAYLLNPGPVRLGIELRGTFYANRKDNSAAETRFEMPASPTTTAHVKPVLRTPRREGQFVDPTGHEHRWKVDASGCINVDGRAYIPLDEEGVYWCQADDIGEAMSPLDGRRIVEKICARGGPSGADFVRVRLVDHIDATRTDHEFSEDGPAQWGGKSRVLKLGDRSFRVTANRLRLSYFAYTATCRHPRNPHLMMFQSINDIERYTTIRIQPPWDNVGGGVYTGREYPCDGKPFEHRFIFYPRDKDIRFTVSRWPVEKPIRPESGAAVSHVWLFELVDAMALRPVCTSKPAGIERRLGMYLTHPAYLYSLYGYRGDTPEERRASLRSFVDYLKFCGINLLEFNAVDGGDTTGTAYYDSKIWPKATGDVLAELLPLCEANDISLIPMITSLSVPEGKFGFTQESFQMDRFGGLTTFFGSRPPLPDPLRPEVQNLLVRNLKEILELCSKSKAVPGIGFRVNGKIGLCYGGHELGKSDQYTGYSP